ncbi:hypothetical protein GW755_03870 [bacterium]|nr:hypothetical protein [bacterium]
MKNDLPQPLSLKKTLGPTFILLGLALGSGELILWPYITANYGLGLIWGALLGIAFQFILNTEIMRYTLYWGESIFLGFKKLHPALPYWFVISTFIPWALPGFSSASAQIISKLFNLNSQTLIAIVILLVVGVILTVGKSLYKTMETLQKTIIMVGLPLILILTIYLTNSKDWADFTLGLVGKGEGFWFFPKGVSIAAFLGAFAFSGAGGNLNFAQSYYIKEKGLGMGKFAAKITSLFTKSNEVVDIEGQTFEDNDKNRKTWEKLWKTVNAEHFLVFFGLGFITIAILAVLSKSLLHGLQVEDGLSFIYKEVEVISQRTNVFVGTSFLLTALLMLFSTQIGVLESSSRIISENILLTTYKKGKKFNLSLAFYMALWAQIILGIALLMFGVKEPRLLLTLSALLNAAAMMVAFPLVYILNKKYLKKHYQPKFWRIALMFIALVFFVIFLAVTIKQNL